jgi:hypothetical protein
MVSPRHLGTGRDVLLSFYPDLAAHSQPLSHAAADLRHYCVHVRVLISDEAVEVRLSPWEKILGLLGNIRVGLTDVGEVEVVAKPVGAVIRSGLMVGLRIPGLYYVARTIRLDQAFLVRRGVPALSFSVCNEGTLKHVIVSTPEAEALARQLKRRMVGAGFEPA